MTLGASKPSRPEIIHSVAYWGRIRDVNDDFLVAGRFGLTHSPTCTHLVGVRPLLRRFTQPVRLTLFLPATA